MTISGALSNALSGLHASARGVEVVSSNLSNALTEGYGRRELALSTRTLDGSGQGVRVDGVRRVVDAVVLADRRVATAAAARDGRLAAFHADLVARIGLPDAPWSLAGQVGALETALTSAIAAPESESRLAAVLSAATGLATTFRDLSGLVQQARTDADADIARTVDRVNIALGQVAGLNAQISALSGRGDATALIDERQRLIDEVARAIPLSEVPRDRDQVALVARGGAVLLDSRPAVLGFSPAGMIVAGMQVGGALAGPTVNGRAVVPGLLDGGGLGALFTLRDAAAPAAQARLDALARDLAERFAGLDATLPPGAAGLFTDAGAPPDPAAETGLSARLTVNPAADGAPWRLRDGLGAATPGPVGNPATLQAMAAALAAPRVPASLPTGGAAISLAGGVGNILSFAATGRQDAEVALAHANARLSALAEAERAAGVDSDAELQHLLLLEQAYAANARVIRGIDEMIGIILGL